PFSILSSALRGTNSASSPLNTATTEGPSLADSFQPFHNQKTMLVEQDLLSSPATSRPPSVSSIASTQGKPRKRTSRPKTIYKLAHPPRANPRHKLHIRPKVLLQLQQLLPSSRPKPVYEVIPSALLASRSTRRFARSIGSKDRLGPNDLLVVKAEEYERKDEQRTDEERWGSRDVMGVICVGRKDDKEGATRTEILMEDGSCWEVIYMPNGGYEFTHTDEHGLTLKRRWVPKPAHSRRTSSLSNNPQSPPAEDKRFNFSTISATSRRHPIIARMGRSSMEVVDSYTMPSATSPSSSTPASPALLTSPLATPSNFTSTSSFFNGSEPIEDRLPIETDDALRRFIVVTGIWVAFCENWSDAYNYARTAYPPLLFPHQRPAGPNRTVSMSVLDSPRSSSPASATDERRAPKLFRSGTFLNRIGDFNPRTGSTRKRFGLALENQGIAETEEERQSKRSLELLRLKEMALLPSPPLSQTNHVLEESTTRLALQILEPQKREIPRTPSPATQERRQTKSQSAYNPITTAGLWDSGVANGNGLKSRPTSLVVLNEKNAKALKRKKDKKEKEKDKGKTEDGEDRRKRGGLKRMFSIFRRK
ncbi:hypothetical protein GQ43DRAFT_348448, partial [Delitschia confertaspora ATCC 74209]